MPVSDRHLPVGRLAQDIHIIIRIGICIPPVAEILPVPLQRQPASSHALQNKPIFPAAVRVFLHNLQRPVVQSGCPQCPPVTLECERARLCRFHLIHHHKITPPAPHHVPDPQRPPVPCHGRPAHSHVTQIRHTLQPAQCRYFPRLSIPDRRHAIVVLKRRPLRVRRIHQENPIVRRKFRYGIPVFVAVVAVKDPVQHQVLVLPAKPLPETDRIERVFPLQVQRLHLALPRLRVFREIVEPTGDLQHLHPGHPIGDLGRQAVAEILLKTPHQQRIVHALVALSRRLRPKIVRRPVEPFAEQECRASVLQHMPRFDQKTRRVSVHRSARISKRGQRTPVVAVKHSLVQRPLAVSVVDIRGIPACQRIGQYVVQRHPLIGVGILNRLERHRLPLEHVRGRIHPLLRILKTIVR